MTTAPDVRPSAQTAVTYHTSRVMLGIGLKVASVCIFVAMSTFLKAAEGIPAGQLVFFRSFFAIFPVVLFLAMRGDLMAALSTRHFLGHVWRGVIGVTSMGLGFFALTKLPLPEAITINYATPLLIVVFSAVFLRETVKLYRWTAVLLGMVGVVIIMWPRLSVFSGGAGFAGEETIGAIAALSAAAVAACAMLMVRRLVRTERTGTIVLYFSITSSVVALATIPFGWVWPTPQQSMLLIGAGIAGGVAQILLTECYRHADISIIAPFEYSSLILGLVTGYLIFGDIPTIQMLVGGAIVIAAGLFIIYREHKLGLERAEAGSASTPQG